MTEHALPSNTTYTVSELVFAAKRLLETQFSTLSLSGEIANFSRPASGHWYFTLKDPFAQIRCAMFKRANSSVDFIPEDGMQVVIRGQISLYPDRGDFQCIVSYMSPSGIGLLKQQFEKRVQALKKAGLFDDAHKQVLPKSPACIAVVTSSTGAALQDILHVCRRRFPATKILIYPTQVQGDAAAGQIVQAIELANKTALNNNHKQIQKPEVILLARGGGSLEDLWPFNEEIVAHAIFNSKLPVITGVGHETDTTIADLVADYRAPTPSAAAEMLTHPISST